MKKSENKKRNGEKKTKRNETEKGKLIELK